MELTKKQESDQWLSEKPENVQKVAQKIFPFEIEIVGKNQHSVWTKCKQCLQFGINMPLEKKCGNCGYTETITYYDAETIQKFINSLIERFKSGG